MSDEYCSGCGKKMIPSDDPAVELVCPDWFTESMIFHDIVSRELDAALDGIIMNVDGLDSAEGEDDNG